MPRVTLYDKYRRGYPNDPLTLGDQIRKRRLDLGMTLQQAAAAIGTRKTLLHEWEKDRKRPAAWWQKAVVNFLGYDPFGGSYVAKQDAKGRSRNAKTDS